MLVIFLVIGGAVVLGLVGNLLFHERIMRITTRRGIDAKSAVRNEAAVVTSLFDTAEYLPDREQRRMQSSVTCYARAVAGPEWDAMRKGSHELSSEPSVRQRSAAALRRARPGNLTRSRRSDDRRQRAALLTASGDRRSAIGGARYPAAAAARRGGQGHRWRMRQVTGGPGAPLHPRVAEAMRSHAVDLPD